MLISLSKSTYTPPEEGGEGGTPPPVPEPTGEWVSKLTDWVLYGSNGSWVSGKWESVYVEFGDYYIVSLTADGVSWANYRPEKVRVTGSRNLLNLQMSVDGTGFVGGVGFLARAHYYDSGTPLIIDWLSGGSTPNEDYDIHWIAFTNDTAFDISDIEFYEEGV